MYKEIDLISCGGIEIRNLRAEPIAKRKILEEPVLEKFQFVSHTNNEVNIVFLDNLSYEFLLFFFIY